jgi:predicted AAA+ superfamily ATPase
LKEEIIDEALTRKVDVFARFLELAAQYNGQIFTYSKLAKELRIDERTLKTHYEILEDTMIINTIPAWTQSEKKRLQSSSKHYFFDNGVLNALRGELKTELNQRNFRYGQLFENFVINEIIKINFRLGGDYKLYHYRTDKGNEIDLIMQKNSFTPPIAIEIKSSELPDIDDLGTLKSFKDEFTNAQLFCVCRCTRSYTEGAITFIPYLDFLELVSK